jgi:hypothetical protein
MLVVGFAGRASLRSKQTECPFLARPLREKACPERSQRVGDSTERGRLLLTGHCRSAMR